MVQVQNTTAVSYDTHADALSDCNHGYSFGLNAEEYVLTLIKLDSPS